MHIDTYETEDIESGNVVLDADADSSPLDLEVESFPQKTERIQTVAQLDEFIEDNFNELRRVVSGQCFRTPEHTDDVIQELYPRLVRFLERSPDGINEPWALVRTIARRLAIDEFRRAMTRARRFVPLYDETFLTPFEDDDESGDTEERTRISGLVLEAIRSLKDRQRSVIHGIFLDGKTGRDVARDLGLSESYTAELKGQAVSLLRSHLQQLRTAGW